MTVHDLVNAVTSGNIDHLLKASRNSEELGFLSRRAQIISAAEKFSRLYPLRDDIRLFFAPVSPDISLKFGELSISAVSSPAVVIAAFHEEGTMSVSAGDFTGIFDKDTGSSEDIAGDLLRDIAGKYDSISGFDLIIESPEPITDASLISSVVEAVLDCFYKKASGDPSINPELFFAGYSLCVTELPSPAESRVKNVFEPSADLTEEEFYSRLPELKKEMSLSKLLEISRSFRELRRSELISEAVRSGDTSGFFRLIDNSSGALTPEAELAIDLSSRLLQGDGAALAVENSVAAFVPTYTAAGYAEKMKQVFGNCSISGIGSSAAVEISI